MIDKQNLFNKLQDIFKDSFDISNIKKISPKIRKTSLPIYTCFLYKFLYCSHHFSKEKVACFINSHLLTSFARNSFESKENNINIKCYTNLFNKLKTFYTTYISKSSNTSLAICSIDGTHNNDNKHNVMLNMGFFDSTNLVPIDLICNGQKTKNKEIKYATQYISTHLKDFKNKILVFDRFYSSFDFIKFLITNDLKFIIRQKKNSVDANFKKINKQLRTINIDHIYVKNINSPSKKSNKTSNILIDNSYLFITNLDNTYTDDLIFKLYEQRWGVEIFFGFIKNNFKFQNIMEHDLVSIKKMYICELILYYLKNILKYILNINHQINEKLFLGCIMENLLIKLFNGNLDYNALEIICKLYTKKTYNTKGRHYARISKKPFSKWYVKAYSDLAKYEKIINAIKNKEIYKLNKNEKLIANKIIDIT